MSAWSEEENLALLNIWGEEDILVEFDGTRRNGRVYRLISDRMKARGFDRSPEQCQSKVKWFKYEYKEATEHRLRPSGTMKTSCKYFDEIDSILNKEKIVGRYPKPKHRGIQVISPVSVTDASKTAENEETKDEFTTSPRTLPNPEASESSSTIKTEAGDSETEVTGQSSKVTNSDENGSASKRLKSEKESRIDTAIAIMKKILQNQQETVDSLAEEEVAVIEEAADEMMDWDEHWRLEEREHQMKLFHIMVQMIAQLFGRSAPTLTQFPEFLNQDKLFSELSTPRERE